MMNSTQPNPSSPPESDVEQLSAYLDNQLSVAERMHIERRVEAEPALRAELESLRATVGALRDLEPVRPPRSFTLDPAKVARPRRIFPLAWVMQMGSGLAGLALVLLATVQMMAFGAVPAAPAAMSTKSAPAEQAALPTDTAIMSAPAPDARVAEATAAPAATMAPAEAPAAAQAPAPTAAPAAESAPMAADAAPTSDIAAMVIPTPEVANSSAGGGAPPAGGAGGPPSIDQTTDALQSSANSEPDTAELPASEAPATARPQGVPPGLTLAIGVALMGLAAAWYLAGRRA